MAELVDAGFGELLQERLVGPGGGGVDAVEGAASRPGSAPAAVRTCGRGSARTWPCLRRPGRWRRAARFAQADPDPAGDLRHGERARGGDPQGLPLGLGESLAGGQDTRPHRQPVPAASNSSANSASIFAAPVTT